MATKEESKALTDQMWAMYNGDGKPENQKSLREVGEAFGVKKQAVEQRLRSEYAKSMGYAIRKRDKPLSKALLQKLYVDQGKTITEIAESQKRDAQTVRRYLVLHGIPIRDRDEVVRTISSKPRVEISKEELRRLWVDEGKTQEEIGAIYGYGQQNIARLIKEYGITKDVPDAEEVAA